MRKGLVLITNNPLLRETAALRFVRGSSVDVLTSARDAVHLGAVLLNHPLYGNFRPNQQPFRSILVKENKGAQVDYESLSMIDSAMAVYREAPKVASPEDLTPELRRDYSFADFELMRESLNLFGLLDGSVSRDVDRSRCMLCDSGNCCGQSLKRTVK